MNNDSIIEAWNTLLFDKFIRFQHILVDGLSSHSNTLLERNIHHKGSRVLDVGCGFGDTTLKLASMVGQSGEAVGVNCAPKFIRKADAGKAKLGLQNANFVVLMCNLMTCKVHMITFSRALGLCFLICPA